MKKILLLALLTSFSGFAMAQELEDIRNLAILNQFAKAKDAVDKYLLVEKNAKKPDGWYWKAYIIDMLSKDSTKSFEENSATKAESFELLKKYRQMDPKAPLLEDDHNSVVYDLYLGFGSEIAIKAYQAKNLNTSFDNFKKALEVHEYSVKNNLVFNNSYKFPVLDTLFTQYAGIVGGEAKRPDEAAVYHKKIVDAGLSGDTYLDSYNFLVDYYRTKKDNAAFDDLIVKAKSLYPKNDKYWTAVEIEMATDGIARPAVFQKYEELVTKNPTNYDLSYRYAAELFNYLNSDESKGPNVAEYKAKLVDRLKKTIALESTFEANFLTTVVLYNNSFDLGDEATKVKGVKPEDQKKKKALQADAQQALTDAIPFGENAVKSFSSLPKKSNTERGNYKKLVTILKNIFDVKKNTAKAAEYDKLIKEAE
jgi:hypothetical protein